MSVPIVTVKRFRWTISLNVLKCMEWDINLNQGALIELFQNLQNWAEPVFVDNELYFWVSRNTIIEQLPLNYSKEDTVYRHLKILHEKKIISYKKQGRKDLVKLTSIGLDWNSKVYNDSEKHQILGNEFGKNKETNPKEIGINSETSDLVENESEKNSKLELKSAETRTGIRQIIYNKDNISIRNISNDLTIPNKNENIFEISPKIQDAAEKTKQLICKHYNLTKQIHKREEMTVWAELVKCDIESLRHIYDQTACIIEIAKFPNERKFLPQKPLDFIERIREGVDYSKKMIDLKKEQKAKAEKERNAIDIERAWRH